jgi:hypothetical protein
MQVPAIRIESETPRELPPLILTAEAFPYGGHSFESLTYRTQHYQAEVSSRYAKCLAEGRGRRCETIPSFDGDGFRVERDGFLLSGRWYMFDVAAKSPFSAELRLAFDPARKWRFASNEIEVRDLATGESRTYKFDSFRVYLRYHAPFGSALTGVDAPAGGNTEAHIDFSLPQGRPSWVYVSLPPLVINGREHVLQPIKLELRRLDFGLEPFNC